MRYDANISISIDVRFTRHNCLQNRELNWKKMNHLKPQKAAIKNSHLFLNRLSRQV